MVKLAILADDLTGSLDTGIKFSKRGIRTRVFITREIPFEELSEDTECIVIDTETRHTSKEEAATVIREAASACIKAGIRTFYKKTDSALRGHIGSELAALSEAVGKSVRFIPALPGEDRYTAGGIHYIKGLPVSESIFGQDPFNPVTESSVKAWIRKETTVTVDEISELRPSDPKAGIVVYDGRTEDDLASIGRYLHKENGLDATAGCAGFADVLAEIIDFTRCLPATPEQRDKLIVISGSINRVSLDQLAYASENGFRRHTFSAEELLKEDLFQTQDGEALLQMIRRECDEHDKIIFDVHTPGAVKEAADYALSHNIPDKEIPVRIAARLGEIFARIAKNPLDAFIMIIGGDTFFASIKEFPGIIIKPVCEPAPGTVLMEGSVNDRNLSLLSKSGGFGEKDLLIKLSKQLIKRR